MRLIFETVIIFVGIILGIESFYPDSVLSRDKMYIFLNSNFFSALIVFIVGAFAIGLYIKQKREHKRDAAKLILQEIRYAEQQIRNAREVGYNYYLANKLLPTNNWNDNIHLFIKELKEIELDLISKFYSNAAYLDNLINKISDLRSQNYSLREFPLKSFKLPSIKVPDGIESVEQRTYHQISPEEQIEEPIKGQIPSQQLPMGEQILGQPNIITQIQLPTKEQMIKGLDDKTNVILRDVSKEIEFIYNSPVVSKLGELSQKKWYQIL